jgi:hypothetical protein
MNIAAIGTSVFGFLKRIPDWVLWVLAAIIFLKFVDMRAEHRGRKKAEAKFDRESAEAEAAVVKQIQENSDDLLRQSDAVRSHDSASVLPDGSARLPDYHYRD